MTLLSYGALVGYLISLFLRLLLGVPEAGFPGLFTTPGFPYKSALVLAHFAVTAAVSAVANGLFFRGRLGQVPFERSDGG